MLIQQIVFYVFATMAVLAGVLVISVRNPVHSALFLVGAFVATAALWLLLQVEFLGLALIFVYVGAVMTLFLFVIMMLNVKDLPKSEGFVHYFAIGLVVVALLILTMLFVISPEHFILAKTSLAASTDIDNTKALGSILYTQYVYAFELAAVLLLVAIVSAISLGFRGRRAGSKTQRPDQQIKVKASERLRIIRSMHD